MRVSSIITSVLIVFHLSCGRVSEESGAIEKDENSATTEESTSIETKILSLGDWTYTETDSPGTVQLTNEELGASLEGKIVWEENGRVSLFVSSFIPGNSSMSLDEGSVLFGVGSKNTTALFFDIESQPEFFMLKSLCPSDDKNILTYHFDPNDENAYFSDNIFSTTISDTSILATQSSSLSNPNFEPVDEIFTTDCQESKFTENGTYLNSLDGFGFGEFNNSLYFSTGDQKAENSVFAGQSFGMAFLSDGNTYPAMFAGSTVDDSTFKVEISSFSTADNAPDSNFFAANTLDTESSTILDNTFFSTSNGQQSSDLFCSFSVHSFVPPADANEKTSQQNNHVVICSFSVIDDTPNDMSDNAHGLYVGFKNE